MFSVIKAVVKKVAEKYRAVSTYKEFENHAHWVIGDPGWEEIAAFVDEWTEKGKIYLINFAARSRSACRASEVHLSLWQEIWVAYKKIRPFPTEIHQLAPE